MPPSGQDQPLAAADEWALAPPAPPSSDERLWAAVAHLSVVLLGIVVPVALMLTKGKDSEFVTEHALEALNFQVTAFIAVIVAEVLGEVVIGPLLVYGLVAVVVFTAWLAARAAYRGDRYRYPITLRVLQDDARSG
ncbi:MAG: DUF4870 domain-containing protein [Acidimicrobiales bacterium]